MIKYKCKCGKEFNLGDEFAGKSVKCPVCKNIGTVPAGASIPTPAPSGKSPSPVQSSVPSPQTSSTPVSDYLLSQKKAAGAGNPQTNQTTATPKIEIKPQASEKKPVFTVPADEPEESSFMTTVVTIGVLILFVAGYFWYEGRQKEFGKNNPELWVVNTTGLGNISIRIDNETVIKNLPHTLVESKELAKGIRVKTGSHKLDAVDANNQAIESISININEGSRGWLFAPKHDPSICFAVMTTGYGTSKMGDVETLYAEQSLWEMQNIIDRWFEPSPKELVVQKGSSATYDRAVRMIKCEDLKKGIMQKVQ